MMTRAPGWRRATSATGCSSASSVWPSAAWPACSTTGRATSAEYSQTGSRRGSSGVKSPTEQCSFSTRSPRSSTAPRTIVSGWLVAGVDRAAAGHPHRAAAPRGGQAGHGLVEVGGRARAARVGQRPDLADPLGGEPVAHLPVVGGVGEVAAVDPVAVEEPADRGLQPVRQQVDMGVNHVAVRVAVYFTGHPSGLPGAPDRLTLRGHAGNTHENGRDRKSFSADETRGEPVVDSARCGPANVLPPRSRRAASRPGATSGPVTTAPRRRAGTPAQRSRVASVSSARRAARSGSRRAFTRRSGLSLIASVSVAAAPAGSLVATCVHAML